MIKIEKCLKLLHEGYSLITVRPNKVPNFTWAECQKKALTPEEFTKRYNDESTGAIGIVTGYGDLEVVDVDLKVFSTAKEQVDFWNEYLSFLEDNILDFHEKFVITKTQNDGYHILFKSKRVKGNLKIAKLKGHEQCVIETRGIGGYVYVYDRFLNNKGYLDIQYITDEDRDILFSCSEMYNYIEPTKDIAPDIVVDKFKANDGDLTSWDDFNNKHQVWDIVSNDFDIVRNLKDKYVIKRHGSSSPHSGYIYKDSDMMYLFSTGTIYDAEKPYTAWGAYVKKEFNGDFSKAASQAYKDGYGARIINKKDEPKERIKVNKDDLEFPIDIYPEPIQQYILECAETLNMSVDYMGCSLLWLISLSIGNSMKIEVKKNWIEIASVWIAVVGKAGIGKTPSISKTIFPVEKLNNREISNYIKEYEKFEWFDKLTKKEKEETIEVVKPRKKQFIANDITVEALVDLHQENDNAVGVFKDELAGWFKDMNKYKQGSDLEFWLSTWSGKSVNLNRMTRAGSFVDSPFIPVLGGIQPSIFNSFYTDENKDNGFMDRMLLSYPDLKAEKFNELEMEEEAIQWYNDVIIKFYETVKSKALKRDGDGKINPIIAKFSPEAKKEYTRASHIITDKLNSNDENEYMKSMLPKQQAYLARFALLLNVFNNYIDGLGDVNYISKDNMLKAERLSNYFIAMAKKVKIDSIEVSDIKKIIKANSHKTNRDKVQALYKENPNLNTKEASEQLGVSLTLVYRYINELKKQ